MARVKAAWGMEIGASAIKAVRLERDGDQVTVTDFAVVPHKKVLATPDVDQDDMVRLTLGQFISQKDLEGEHLVISVPGHAAFARFAKLPPVDPKKVPDIVKFEAVQQIPFPIDQVEWDYQTFAQEGSPEIEVGIFAITRDRVQQRLALYRELGISPEALTLSPVAVYNAMAYDHDLAGRKGPVIYLDIGTYATDVIVAEQGRCWIRTFPLGGTHFTEAIATAFKLSYSKAEKLKHEAAASKYAKQIMQAMRPVFSDLLQDLQRSIGYYQSLHRDAELSMMVGLGSTFKIPGLRKFLGQQLQMQVVRLDEYRKITVAGREAATFASNAVGMATAYGLALQGVGLGRINVSLVPVETVRAQLWREKTKWFGAAAAVVVVGSAMLLYRPIADRNALSAEPESPEVTQVMAIGERLKKDYESISRESRVGFAAENFRRLVDWRTVWPSLVYDAAQAVAAADPQPELLSGDPAKIRSVPVGERRLVELSDLGGQYVFDSGRRRIAVTMWVEFTNSNREIFLNGTVLDWLRDNAEREGVPYKIITESISMNTDRWEDVDPATGAATRSPTGGAPKPPPGRSTGTFGGSRPGGPPAPPDAGGSGGPTGGFGAGGGENIGRRQKNKPKRGAPGSGLGGGFGQSGTPNPPAPGGGYQGPRGPLDLGGGGTPSGSRSSAPRDHVSLEALAPLPERPDVYAPGMKKFRAPVTFEVELIDPTAPPQTQARSGGRKEGRS